MENKKIFKNQILIDLVLYKRVYILGLLGVCHRLTGLIRLLTNSRKRRQILAVFMSGSDLYKD